MAKHRKTRKEKVRSDFRQQHVITPPQESVAVEQIPQQQLSTFRFTLPSSDQKKQVDAPAFIKSTTGNYAYVGHDLRKTGIVTAGIILAQLVLFMSMK